MNYEIVLTRNGYKQVLQVVTGTFKNLNVWKVRFQDGSEVMLFKCGAEWFQRHQDNIENALLKMIGEKIDHIRLGIALS